MIANYNKSEEAKELKRENSNIKIYKADVSKRDEVHQMVEYVIEKYKKWMYY